MPRTIAFLRLVGFCPASGRRETGFALSETFWERCALLTPWVEPVEGHEAFLDLTGLAGLPPAGPTSQALPPPLAGLLADLRRLLGMADLELRAGLAANRLVARVAADQLEGEGCRFVPPGEEASFLAPLPPSALWTVSPAVRRTLSQLGLATLADVRAVPESALHRLCGPEAHLLLCHAQGRDDSPVPLFLAPRRLRRAIDLPLDLSAWPEVAAILREAADCLAGELAERRLDCLRLRLTLELTGGETHTTRSALREPSATVEALLAALEETARRLLSNPALSAPPRRLVVEVETSRSATQLPLLPAGPPVLHPGVADEVLAGINRAFSTEVLFPAARLTPSRRERFRRLFLEFGHAAP
ncbi:MAG: hypothetical protein ACM3XZ_03975 [Betaproteobacteria bacterium]